jgi:3,4-dihydroxy 2-butanone 4-phosphate synthase/GTP cyclohydrolase II
LKDLGIRKMKLLAKPGKLPTMAGYDLEVTGHLPYQAT